jgi:hypothetical protein
LSRPHIEAKFSQKQKAISFGEGLDFATVIAISAAGGGGMLLAQGQVLEGELTVAADEEREEPEQVE